MKIRKKILFLAMGFATVTVGVIGVPNVHMLYANNDEKAGESYSDQSGLFLSLDVDGNVTYKDVQKIDKEEELALPELKKGKAQFELHYRLTNDSDEQIVDTFDTFEEANAAMRKRSMFRSSGEYAVYSDDQLRNIQYGVVDFNTRGDKTTNYTEDGTNIAGYTCGNYAADAAFLGLSADGKKVKFRMAGITGWVDKSAVDIIDVNDANMISMYEVQNGRIQHFITRDILDEYSNGYYDSAQDVGPKQSYMKEGVSYYSYDGHYFYTNYKTMIDDYKAGVFTRAINANEPYYNYFQYLSYRSKTNFSATDFDNRINLVVGNGTSKMKNQGANFVKYQNAYGTNAILTFGIAINESWYGRSQIALDKNNLFGHGAVDSNPYYGANGYKTPADSILYHDEIFVSKGYIYPLDWRYYGPHVGDKASGMNVKYASDPYWGEKAAAQGYALEKQAGYKNKDYGKQTIGVKGLGSGFTIYKEPTTANGGLYTTLDGNNASTNHFPFIILGEVKGQSVNGNTTWYKIQSDAPLNTARSAMDLRKAYNFANDYAYVSAAYVKKVSAGSTPPAPDVAVTSVSMNTTSKSLDVGGTYVLSASVSPTNATNKSITWSSDNPSIVSVNNGTITAKSAGTTTIRATSNNGKVATCKVSVAAVNVPVSSISLNASSKDLNVGGSYVLSASLLPSNATNKSVTWSSDNPRIVSVNNGTITAKSAGTTTIRVTSSNGKVATCKVSVTAPSIPVSSITLNTTSKTLNVNDSVTLQANILPTNATNKSITWSSDDSSIVSVSNGKITAKKAGTTTIRAMSSNGKAATCKITVNAPAYKKGDVNNDGIISASDYVLIKNHVLGKQKLTGLAFKAADYNNDGSVSASDYVLIKLYVLSGK